MAKWKQHFDHEFQLYHLSKDDLGDVVELVPRPPTKNRAMEGEDTRSKRICVSDSIGGALQAIGYQDYDCIGTVLNVYVPQDLSTLFKHDNVYKPSTKQVPDSGVTHEHWIKSKAKFKKVGRIKITWLECDTGDLSLEYKVCGTRCWCDKFTWAWLDEPKDLSTIQGEHNN